MNDTSRNITASGGVVEILVPWLCLSLAGTALLWTLASGPAQLADPEAGLAGYLTHFTSGALAAGVLCGALFAFGATPLLARLAVSSTLAYVCVLKVIGFSIAPWAGLALALAGAFAVRRAILIRGPLLLLLHTMGTMAALYLVFAVGKYLASWRPFLDVLRAMWWYVSA